MQTTNSVVIIEPENFQYNSQTAETNSFQSTPKDNKNQEKALQEFHWLKNILENEWVEVIVIKDTPYPIKPDAIFPNNRISTHEDWTVFLYPMLTLNRRTERKNPVINELRNKYGYEIKQILDITNFENNNKALEWTWSLVLDRKNKIAYISLSPRAHIDVIQAFKNKSQYEIVTFHSYVTDKNNNEWLVYHTNVMMSIWETFAIICLDAIKDAVERENVVHSLQKTNHEIIEISLEQMTKSFSGNMLQIQNKKWETLLVMSTSAYNSLTQDQIQRIELHTKIVNIPIPTIEHIGWWSVRCMLLENFLQKKVD